MAYEIVWKALPGKAIIRTAYFGNFEDARSEADLSALSFTDPVEITINDETGAQRYLKVTD